MNAWARNLILTGGAVMIGGLGYFGRDLVASTVTPAPKKVELAEPARADAVCDGTVRLVEAAIGRKVTTKEKREMYRFLQTAAECGYNNRELQAAFSYGVEGARNRSIVDSFTLAANIQGGSGHFGELTDDDKRQASAWKNCARRIQQIEDGIL